MGFGQMALATNQLIILTKSLNMAYVSLAGSIALALAPLAVFGALHAVAASATSEMNSNLEKNLELNKEISDVQLRATQKEIAGGKDPAEKARIAAEAFEMETEKIKAYESQLKTAQKNLENFNNSRYEEGIGKKLLRGLAPDTGEKGLLEGSVKEIESMLNLAKQRKDELGKDQVVGGPDEKTLDDIKKFNESLREQIDLFGLSTEEQKRQKLIKQAGGNAAFLGESGSLIKDLEARRERDRLRKEEEASLARVKKSTEDLNKSLLFQVDTYGMTSREAALYKLQIEGATEAQLASAKAASQHLDKLDEEKKLMDKGKSVIEKYMTPQEKLVKEQGELDKLMEAGAIDSETYRRALADLHGQTQEDYKVKMGVTGIDSVLAGSADAFARIREQRDLLSQGGRISMGMKPNGVSVTSKAMGAAALAGGDKTQDRVAILLTEIRDAIVSKDTVEVAQAELT